MARSSKSLFRYGKWIFLNRVVLGGLLFTLLGTAQQTIPIVNPPGANAPTKPVEMERIEIYRQTALPSSIKRPPGQFVLVLVNETGNPQAVFELDAVITSAAVATAAPIVVFDSHTPAVNHRKAGLLNLTKGQYALKNTGSGRVLCTITIE